MVDKAKKSRTKISSEQAATIVEALDILSKLGIASIAEAAVFCHAALNRDATLTQIVRELRAPFSSVSRVVYQLERRGLVHYEPHPTDRRVKIVRANVSD